MLQHWFFTLLLPEAGQFIMLSEKWTSEIENPEENKLVIHRDRWTQKLFGKIKDDVWNYTVKPKSESYRSHKSAGSELQLLKEEMKTKETQQRLKIPVGGKIPELQHQE